jgi:serine/threonine protein kinase
VAADPRRVEAIFNSALGVPAEDRGAFVAAACAGATELRVRVDRLLAAHAELEVVPEPPVGAPTTPLGAGTDVHTPQPDAGAIFGGKYRLLEEIGSGGMGSVWMAQQLEPVKRFVAVKIIRAGMDSRAVLTRFEAERQALALMDHPNIAKVFDAGAAPDGRPFFVMELVRGVPITQFCDERRLTPRRRLELFVPVCHAIQHAHQKGIIHRDIKPSNVLVALYDDNPVPKVIDFGVAKATGPALTDLTPVTTFGGVVGTVEYMSPEQAGFNNADIDTRSDVYALGVLLYELLTGSPPFSRKELEKVGLLEIFRVIREQEPPRPSTRLSTAAALPTLSANRSTEPRHLTALLRRELDWVVMKALEKNRNRRYESANGFASDVQRYLAGEPVQAVPPSAGYRLRKFLRRNRGPVLAAGLVFVALVAGLVGTVLGLVEARKQEQAARSEAEDKERARGGEAEERRKADAARRTAERNAASLQIALDLADYPTDPRISLLRLARTARGLPDHCRDYREFATVEILCGAQWYEPLVPPITHDGALIFRGQLSPDYRTLATVGADATVRVWDALSGRWIATIRDGAEPLTQYGFSPDGRWLFTDDATGSIRVWDARTGNLRCRTAPRPDRYARGTRRSVYTPASIQFSGDRLVTLREKSIGDEEVASFEELRGPIELWDATTGARIAELVPARAVPDGHFTRENVCFVPGGKWVVVRWDRITLAVFSAGDGRLLARLAHPNAEEIALVGINPAGTRVLTRTRENDSENYSYRIWDTSNWTADPVVPRVSKDRFQSRDSVTYLSDDTFAAGGSFGVVLLKQGRADPLSRFDKSPDLPVQVAGDRAWIGDNLVVDTQTGKQIPPSRNRRLHPDLALFAPDGRFAVPSSPNGDRLLDTLTDKAVISSPGVAGYVPGAGFVGTWVRRAGFVQTRAPNERLVWIRRVALIDVPPDVLELWLQVAVCGELGPFGEFVPYSESTWEQKRRELVARAAPVAGFPFPGYVATNHLHWLQMGCVGHQVGTTEPPLSLLDRLIQRAEESGDTATARLWAIEREQSDPFLAPPPHEPKR